MLYTCSHFTQITFKFSIICLNRNQLVSIFGRFYAFSKEKTVANKYSLREQATGEAKAGKNETKILIFIFPNLCAVRSGYEIISVASSFSSPEPPVPLSWRGFRSQRLRGPDGSGDENVDSRKSAVKPLSLISPLFGTHNIY